MSNILSTQMDAMGPSPTGTIGDLSLADMLAHVAQQPVDAKRIKGLSTSGTLDYAQATSGVSPTVTTEGTAATLVTGNSITLDGATPVLVQFWAPSMTISGGSTRTLTIILTDGTTVLGTVFANRTNAATASPVVGVYRYTPAAGTYAFTAKAFLDVGSNLTVDAGAGGAATKAPMFIRVSRDSI